MHVRRELVGALSAVLVVACSAVAASPNDSTAPGSYVGGVGTLPADLPQVSAGVTDGPSTSSAVTSSPTTTAVPESVDAEGNRILLIGDSVLASTAKRYSNAMCKELVPLGWKVDVEAEVSRGIDFGQKVWTARRQQHWDVVVVFLGNNYGGDEKDYLRRLNRLLGDIGVDPAPTTTSTAGATSSTSMAGAAGARTEIVLVTVTEFRPEQREVNTIIRTIADVYQRVTVLDWAKITAERPELLNDDNIHPTPAGRTVLAESMAYHLGTAPAEPGACLEATFIDDTAGNIDGTPTTTTTATTTTAKAPTTTKPGSTTTVKPSTTTTTKPGATTTTGATTSTVASTTTAATPTTPPLTTP